MGRRSIECTNPALLEELGPLIARSKLALTTKALYRRLLIKYLNAGGDRTVEKLRAYEVTLEHEFERQQIRSVWTLLTKPAPGVAPAVEVPPPDPEVTLAKTFICINSYFKKPWAWFANMSCGRTGHTIDFQTGAHAKFLLADGSHPFSLEHHLRRLFTARYPQQGITMAYRADGWGLIKAHWPLIPAEPDQFTAGMPLAEILRIVRKAPKGWPTIGQLRKGARIFCLDKAWHDWSQARRAIQFPYIAPEDETTKEYCQRQAEEERARGGYVPYAGPGWFPRPGHVAEDVKCQIKSAVGATVKCWGERHEQSWEIREGSVVCPMPADWNPVTRQARPDSTLHLALTRWLPFAWCLVQRHPEYTALLQLPADLVEAWGDGRPPEAGGTAQVKPPAPLTVLADWQASQQRAEGLTPVPELPDDPMAGIGVSGPPKGPRPVPDVEVAEVQPEVQPEKERGW